MVNICKKCESDLDEYGHFGGCPDHPTNIALAGKPRYDDGKIVLDAPKEELPGTSALLGRHEVSLTSFQFLYGSEVKVTEEFMKKAIEKYTGCEVESVKFKAKQFVVRFK